MNADIAHIGLDLGTFKTSAACSNGNREAMYSGVAFPKDAISQSMMDTAFIVGDEVLKQRLSVNAIRPFVRGELKYVDAEQAGLTPEQVSARKEAAQLLIQHVVSRVIPDETDRVYGVIGAPSRANEVSHNIILEAAEEAFDAVMIIPEPFAVAYGMDCLHDTVVVDIGAGTTDICPMYGAFPDDSEQLTLQLGGDYIDEQLLQMIRDKFPDVDVSLNMVRNLKEKHATVQEMAEPLMIALPCGEQIRNVDLADLIQEACCELIGPIVKGIREVIRNFDPEFRHGLLRKVLLAGGGSRIRGLDQRIERDLKTGTTGNVISVYDSVFAGSTGSLKLAMSMPQTHWESIREIDKALVG